MDRYTKANAALLMYCFGMSELEAGLLVSAYENGGDLYSLDSIIEYGINLRRTE